MSRLIAVVLVLCSAHAFAGRNGRVLRVERAASSSSVPPRLCELRGEVGTCIGEEPRIGQTVIVIDERRVITEVQILEATSIVASCANLWTVKIRARVLDKAHLPAPPSGLPSEEVWRAIDRDGDGNADVLITRYGCDGSGKPMPGATTYCIDVWSRTGARMTRTTQINLAQCNI